jgi:uncharacterized protein
VPRFEPDRPAPGPLIQGFVGQELKVDGKLYGGVLLTPEGVFPWTSSSIDRLNLAELDLLLQLQPTPEFILLGTGSTMAFAPRAVVSALEKLGIGMEAMDSRAAARTWGMLRGQGRWIAAAIMPL